MCDVTTWVVVFATYNSNMATNDSFTTTKERNEILGDKEQVIKPYMFEPNKGDRREASYNSSEDSGSEEEEFDEEFEAANAGRRTSLQWCKCGKCAIMEKIIESFCCHEKAMEYDEYDEKPVFFCARYAIKGCP